MSSKKAIAKKLHLGPSIGGPSIVARVSQPQAPTTRLRSDVGASALIDDDEVMEVAAPDTTS